MIHHTNSFLVSLFLHLLLLGVLFLSYTYISSKISEKKETKVCINLSCIQAGKTKETPTPLTAKYKTPKKKIQKKIRKKTKTPKKKKVVQHKTIVPKKELAQSVVEEVVSKPKVTKEINKSHVLVTPTKSKIVLHKTQKVSAQKKYVDENLAKIAQLLQENLYYPRRAKKRGLEGEVVVKFKLSINAEVTELEVISSEHDILSRGAIKTIENLSSKFPKPKEELELSVPIYYKLY